MGEAATILPSAGRRRGLRLGRSRLDPSGTAIRHAATPRCPRRCVCVSGQFQQRHYVVYHTGSGVVLLEIGPELLEAGIVDGIRAVLLNLVGPLLSVGDSRILERFHQLVFGGVVRRELPRRLAPRSHLVDAGGGGRRVIRFSSAGWRPIDTGLTPSLGRAILRAFTLHLFAPVVVFPVLVRDSRQGWHDDNANTVVVATR